MSGLRARLQAIPTGGYAAAFCIALCATTFYSMKPVFIKLAFANGASVNAVMAWRMALSLPVFLAVGVKAWQRRTEKPSARQVAQAAFVGILGYYGASYLDVLGLQYVSAQLERLILFCYPALVILATAFIRRQPISAQTSGALGLAYAGLGLLFGHDLQLGGADTLLGTALVFGSAVAYAGYLMLSGGPIAAMGSLLFTAIAMSAACFAVLAQAVAVEGLAGLAITPAALAWMAAVALISTVLASFLQSEAIARLGAARSSVVGSTGPLLTSVAAVVLLGEPFGPYHAAGLALATAGMVVLSRKKQQKKA